MHFFRGIYVFILIVMNNFSAINEDLLVIGQSIAYLANFIKDLGAEESSLIA